MLPINKIAVVSTLILSFAGCGLFGKKVLTTDEMAGTYELRIGSDCRDRGIEVSRLALSPDGSFEQHTKLIGEEVVIDHGKWSMMQSGNIFVDGMRDSTGHVPSASPRVMRNASLIVESNDNIIILLDPDKNCFYERKKGR